jgi:hypothetical protein
MFTTTEDVDLRPGREAVMTIGGKLNLALNPDEQVMALTPNGSASLNWSMKIGENVELNSIGSGRGSPKVSFMDMKGQVLETAAARYT